VSESHNIHNIHATGIVLDGIGVILRGPPGSGKSVLALDLLDWWEARGLPARLVSDDRVEIIAENGKLTMHPAPNIAGLIELRGRGIVSRPHVGKAPLHLVVDLVPRVERMVEEEQLVVDLMGVSLPRCPVPKAGVAVPEHQLLLVVEALNALAPRRASARQKNT
jgi:serine kinase of HPr protein (carbohydrate metabolism regulator)